MAEQQMICSADMPDAVNIEFHGVLYTINITTVGEEILAVTLEDRDSCDRWKGEFVAKYVEDITSKTGNFKKFAVFVRMLQTAVTQQSDSVFVDLLTLQDLELLKSKKDAASGITNGPPAVAARQLPASNKRYLILTYASEFDRVHYPLPLLPENNPDPQRLKAIIKQLRLQLGELQAAQQPQQQLPPARQRDRKSNSQITGMEEHDLALLSSRIEVLKVQLERERADHRRELRRKAQDLQEVQEELSRSRDVIRDLRLRIKTLEQQQSSRPNQQSNRNPASSGSQQHYNSSSNRWSESSSGYLSGSGQYPSKVSKYPSRPVRHSSSTTAGSRGSSPASSRAHSPGYNRPWAQVSTPPRPPRPNSAPPKQRFDPTEYVRQKRAREQAATQRMGGSRGNSPARSNSSRERERLSYSNASSPRVAGSGVLTPRGLQSPVASATGGRRPGSSGSGSGIPGVTRQGSVGAQRRSSSSSTGGGYGNLRPTLSSSSSFQAAGEYSRSGSNGRQRLPQQQQQQQVNRSSSRDRERLGAVYGAAAGVSNRSRSSSKPAGGLDQWSSGREGPGAASPGRALQGVKDKLSAYMAKQQRQEEQPQQHLPGSRVSGQTPVLQPSDNLVDVDGPLVAAAGVAGVLPSGGETASGNTVFESASSDLADIDQRLSALQNFLKKAKATVAAS